MPLGIGVGFQKLSRPSGSILSCELRSHEHADREPTHEHRAKADNFPAYCETGRVKAGYGCFSGFNRLPSDSLSQLPS
jgi:hypothetical protein